MALSDPWLQSEPCEVEFAGFVSNTYTLQRAGWQLAVNQDRYNGHITLAMKFPMWNLKLISTPVRVAPRDMLRSGPQAYFRIANAGSDFIGATNMDFSKFGPIDAEPTWSEVKRPKMSDYNMFAPLIPETEQIIVEPQSVAECLELIRKMQAPQLQEIRKRNLDRNEASKGRQFHAQIMSMAA